MIEEKKEEVLETKEPLGWYKGYYIRALKQDPDHVDYYLVAEYEAIKEKENA